MIKIKPNEMSYIIPGDSKIVDAQSFVKFWKQFYDEQYAKEYDEVIASKSWTEEDLEKLFNWKNNMGKKEKKMSKSKKAFVKNASEHLEWLNESRGNVDLTNFLKLFKKAGPIWAITLLHALDPSKYPIFDQHVYRAFLFLSDNTQEDLKRRIVYDRYQTNYMPFFQKTAGTIEGSGLALKDLDNSLWAFGRFLSQYPTMLLRRGFL